jgi:hypothetical protein
VGWVPSINTLTSVGPSLTLSPKIKTLVCPTIKLPPETSLLLFRSPAAGLTLASQIINYPLKDQSPKISFLGFRVGSYVIKNIFDLLKFFVRCKNVLPLRGAKNFNLEFRRESYVALIVFFFFFFWVVGIGQLTLEAKFSNPSQEKGKVS